MNYQQLFDSLTQSYIIDPAIIDPDDVIRKYFSDDDLDIGRSIARGTLKRDDFYTELLSDYNTLTRRRNKLKETHKWIFFWCIIGGAATAFIFLIIWINQLLSNDSLTLTGNIITMISALASLVATLTSIPLIITKYLFNTKEDDNITKIIAKTQEHDSKNIELLSPHFAPRHPHEDGNQQTEEVRQSVEDVLNDFQIQLNDSTQIP